MTEAKHLWEVEHRYYGPDHCYYATGYQAVDAAEEFNSWADFVEDGGLHDADLDMNFLYRWDWTRDTGRYSDEGDDSRDPDKLLLFYMCPRKGVMLAPTIIVTEADEPAVREWLEVRAKYMAAMWAPFDLAVLP